MKLNNLYIFVVLMVIALDNSIADAKKKNKDKKVAIKAMKKIDIVQSKHVDHIENEKKILEMINHPFIVSW